MGFITIIEIIGAFMLGSRGGFAAGRRAGRKKAEKLAALEAAKPKFKCDGCQHAYSYHEGESGTCGYSEGRYETHSTIAKDGNGKVIRDHWDVPVKEKKTTLVGTAVCPCKKYTGDIPLPTYLA